MYKGDLSPGFSIPTIRPALDVLYRYNLSYSSVLRANMVLGSITADGANSPNVYIAQVEPNAFRSPIFEITGMFEYNFFDFRDPKQERVRGTPYLHGGIGFFVFRPGGAEALRTSPVQPVIPFGIGYKYRLSKNFNISAEFGARKTFTDLLDDVKDTDQRTGRQRGYKYDRDWYGFAGVMITYTLYEIVCPFDYNQ